MDSFFAEKSAYVVLSFAAVTIPAGAAVIAYFWYKLRREELVTNLKRELLQHGMSADEIRAVVEAAPHGSTDVAQDLAAFNGTPVASPKPVTQKA
jgi:hypothetical protein